MTPILVLSLKRGQALVDQCRIDAPEIMMGSSQARLLNQPSHPLFALLFDDIGQISQRLGSDYQSTSFVDQSRGCFRSS